MQLARTADVFSVRPASLSDTYLCSARRPQLHLSQVNGILSKEEADQYIRIGEATGFQHQSSRGPAYGEASAMCKD